MRDLTALVERLSSRLGRQAVVRVRLRPEAQPELSGVKTRGSVPEGGALAKKVAALGAAPEGPFRQKVPVPFSSRGCRRVRCDCCLVRGCSGFRRRQRRKRRRKRGQAPFMHSTGHRPKVVGPFRQKANLLGRSHRRVEPPRQFCLAGKQYRLARHWGPERIETGWWRGQSAGRDYFRVETATGARYWLFRRLRDGKWFLHGTFEIAENGLRGESLTGSNASAHKNSLRKREGAKIRNEERSDRSVVGQFVPYCSPLFAISLLRAFAVIPITMLKSPKIAPWALLIVHFPDP